MYRKIMFLFKIYSYMFRHLRVIIREFYIFCLAKLHRFLKLKLLKSQFHKFIKLLQYYLIVV